MINENEKLLLQNKLQIEYEILIKSKWKFLENEYRPIEKKYHRTELQEIKHIETIKKNIENKIGVIPTFLFLTDFCNNFDLPGPYRNIDKALIILEHLLNGVSINQMETYLPHSNFFRIYKYLYIKKYDELNDWVNNILYNYCTNKRIRLLNSYIKNPEMMKHVTLILDGHHNKIIYENVDFDRKDLYSWKLKKPGLNTQFIIDINDIAVFISDSLPCKNNNDDKMLINNIQFNNFFTLYDNICFDGLYKNTLNETIEKYSLRNLDLKINNFTFPIEKQKNIDLTDEETNFNNYIGGFRSRIESYFANLGKVFKRFDAKNNVRVTKLETYNIQLKLACVLLNIKKFTELSGLNPLHKHSLWLKDGFDYPNNSDIKEDLIKLEYKMADINLMKDYQHDLLNSIISNNNIYIEEKNHSNQDIIDKEKHYEVQYIISHRLDKNGVKEYFVKWKGYKKLYNSWVKEYDFDDETILNEYNRDLEKDMDISI